MLSLGDIRRLGARIARGPSRTLALGSLIIAFIFAVGCLCAFSGSARAAGMTQGWSKVVSGGFTDPNNSYAPSVTEFKGYLYLSTVANESGFVFSKSHKAGGDIWRSTDGVKWEQIGKPGLGNTHNASFNFVTFHDKLYAIANNINDHGIEIWVTEDGKSFTQIEKGGFGDKNSDWAVGFVFADRLILGVSNMDTGAQIWVSEDGTAFRQVVGDGLGDKDNTAVMGVVDQGEHMPVLNGELYVGTSNPESGGEIWRTADGLQWKRVADNGLGRGASTSLTPYVIFQNQLYVAGDTAGAGLSRLKGVDVFRASDGITWEKVVDDGFSVGKERNVTGSLAEFQGKLYLTANTMDPRLLVPGEPSERMAPRGFQLYVSSDGAKWTQVGKDGFGASTTLWADVNVVSDAAYLSAFDYHAGSQLYRSTDGQNWELIFREPNPSFFSEGGGVIDFADHLLWMDNDLATGLEIWRSDAQVVADVTTTTGGIPPSTTSGATVTTGSSTGVSSGGQTGTSTATGVTTGGTNGSVGTKEATSAGDCPAAGSR